MNHLQTSNPASIVEAVRDHARLDSPETGFRFIARNGDDGILLPWPALWDAAQLLAQAMPHMDDPARTGVLIFCDQGQHFVTSLLATWLRGATAIPASSALGIHISERNAHILSAARPELILHDLDNDQANALAARAAQSKLIDVTQIKADAGNEGDTLGSSYPGGKLLQFTSGSTSAPKPVLLNQDQILRNCQAVTASYGLGSQSVGVHWLPFYHDMGLVGSVLVAMLTGGTSIILRPSLFIQNPLNWLSTISRYRANITSAPNFAYDRLSLALERGGAAEFDLSSLRAVVIGGEPVSEMTVTRLLAVLEKQGLDRRAIAPSYGLAEAVLLVSSGQTEEGPVFHKRPEGGANACLGTPVDGVNVSIRNGTTGAMLPEGETGEIWIDGPACGQVIPTGVDWRVPVARAAIRTGDLGKLENGKVFVSGRDADRIILRGRNLFSEEVEAAVIASQDIDAGIEGLVAFGEEAAGTQALIVLIERRPRGPAIDIAALNRTIAARLGVKCNRIVQLRRATLPRTTSGKIRRAAAKEAFLAGQYDSRVLDNVD